MVSATPYLCRQVARIAVVVCVCAASAGCTDRAASLAARGDVLLFERRYEDAARQFEIVLHECAERQDPEAVTLRRSTLRKLGEIRQYYLNDPQGALQAYRGVAELSAGMPEGFEARLRAVRLLKNRIRDPGRAAEELSALIEAYPTRPELDALRLELGQLSFRARHYKDALAQARGALTSESPRIKLDAAMLVASVHEVQGHVGEALKTYLLIFEMPLEPADSARVRFEVAHCYELLGQLPKALELYQRVLAEGSDAELVNARIARVEKRMELLNIPRPRRGGFNAARNSQAPATRPAARATSRPGTATARPTKPTRPLAVPTPATRRKPAAPATSAKPATAKPAAAKAPVTKPATAKPAATRPAVTKRPVVAPAAPKPAAAKPATVKPVAPKPVAPKPAPARPVAPARRARTSTTSSN